MLLALALVCLLIYGYHRSKKIIGFEKQVFSFPKKVKWILVLGIILMVVQIVLGTQVREMIDQISFSLGNMLRDEWIARIGIDFLIHRSFSLLILVISILFLFLIFKFSARKSQINNWSQVLLLFVILEIGSGIGMAYFGVPAFLQPIHLLFGSLIVGVQFLLLLQINEHNQLQKKDN
jgi:cytochrome c oxidase assembly protein subunit 15